MTHMTPAEQRILALVDDLFFTSRIEATLSATGYTVRTLPMTTEAVGIAREWRPDAVVVSIGIPSRDWEGMIRAIRAEPMLREVPLLAFGPHVDTASRAAATAAGATQVVTNGAFFSRMPAIVAALIGER